MGRSGPHLFRWGRTDRQVRTSIRGKINIFQPLSEASQQPPASRYLRVNNASIAALGAEAKKETPAQLVVVQGFSWSGRQDSNLRPSDPQSDALPG